MADIVVVTLFLYSAERLEIYATAQLTPSAVPTAARIADARFHKNLINLVLFSLVIGFELRIKS